jgi:hypothetical protein
MSISRSDLYYKDYNWKAKYENDDPRITGEPDKTLLDRNEGYEVLYFLNAVGKMWGWSSSDKNSYHKIERLIRTKLPGTTRSQENIKAWIEANWKTYWDTI